MDPVSPSPREMKLKLCEFEVHFQGKSRPFLAGDYFCWVTNHVHLHWLVHELLYCTRSFSVPSRWWFKIIEKCFLAKKTWNFAIFGRFWWDLIWQYWVYESQIYCNAKIRIIKDTIYLELFVTYLCPQKTQAQFPHPPLVMPIFCFVYYISPGGRGRGKRRLKLNVATDL